MSGRLLAPLALALATAAAGVAQHVSVVSFGAASGLANLNVTALLEDHLHRVWVGTESGIYLANGVRFQKQQIFQDAGFEYIRALREDDAGRIWAMDTRRVGYEENGSVHIVPGLNLKLLGGTGSDLISLPGDPDTMLLMREGALQRIASADGGKTWLATPAVDAAAMQQHAELKSISGIAAAGKHQVWAGCGTSLCRLNLQRQTAEVYSVPALRPVCKAEALSTWTNLYVSRAGALWARSNQQLVTFDEGAHAMRTVAAPAGLRLDSKRPLMTEDAQGRILLNLWRGLARVSGDRWEVFDDKNGLPQQEIDALASMHAGDVWMGPAGHGLAMWRGYDLWESWTEADGISSSIIWPMARDEHDHLWVANEVTLDRIDLVHHKVEPMGKRLPANRVNSVIVDHRQHVWAANPAGQLFEIDSVTRAVRLAAENLGRVMKMVEDRSGVIWICTRTGLNYLSGADGWQQAHHVGTDQLPEGYAWDLTEGPDGSLWLTTAHGLYRHSGGVWRPIRLPFAGGTKFNFGVAVARDGTLWAQNLAPNPVLHLRVDGDVATVLDRVPTEMIGGDNITFVTMDARDWVWVGTDQGVAVYNGHRWLQCTVEDGLTWDDTDSHAFHQDCDGSVWIGTSGGVAHLLHPERLFTARAPAASFEAGQLGSVALQPGVAQQPFDLKRPTLNVRMLNTAYERGSGVQYRFHLEGLEDGWQDADGSIRYPALASGRYTLSVIAYDKRQHLSSAPVTMTFRVLAPPWRRPWALTLEGLAAVLLILLGVRLNTRRLRARQLQLERLVTERTSELLREKAELSHARAELLEMSRKDTLTGLLSRAAIFEEMNRLCEQAMATGEPLAYAMADLDAFKRINDQFGHVAGDAVLRECAARIRKIIRPGEFVGRYGGEEMLILLPNLSQESAGERLEELRQEIANVPVEHGELSLKVTCSFGLAWLKSQGFTLESLISKADQALYRAKQNGRNRVEFATA